jgi:hypothetical protein
MLSWLLWRLDQLERLHAVAREVIGEFGDGAYAEALRREREAQSELRASDWRRVAAIVARRTAGRAGLSAAVELPLLEFEPARAPTPIAPEPSQPFLIQFVCRTPDRGATSVTEKPIQAADASAAIVAAANAAWPPQTIGLRIFDREGREVFARAKTLPAAGKQEATAPEANAG